MAQKPQRANKGGGCTLYRRSNNQAVAAKDVPREWFRAEIDVTSSTQPASADNQFRALDEAKGKALERFSAGYYCQGNCGADRICTLGVTVLTTRSGRIERRMVPNDPDSFPYKRLGQKESPHVYLTLEAELSPVCACVARPPAPGTAGGGVQQAGASPAPTGIVSFDDD